MGEIRLEGVSAEVGDKQPTEAAMAAAREVVAQKVAGFQLPGRADAPFIIWDNVEQYFAFKQMLDPHYTYEQAKEEWESDASVHTSGPLELEKLPTEVPTQEPDVVPSQARTAGPNIFAHMDEAGKLVDEHTGEEVN